MAVGSNVVNLIVVDVERANGSTVQATELSHCSIQEQEIQVRHLQVLVLRRDSGSRGYETHAPNNLDPCLGNDTEHVLTSSYFYLQNSLVSLKKYSCKTKRY
ncbi:hypothetical protein FRC02_008199 [Tulasnella sp. 418]|nr:hypothetical protein FRC02_008199 [Tulasnella sp. 418]